MIPRPIVMSIRPQYANQILTGSKLWEFRKQPVQQGATVIIYRSGAWHQRGIVGWFTAGRCISGTPEQHCEKTDLAERGIDLAGLKAYAPEHFTEIWRIQIAASSLLPNVLPLSVLGFDRAPQSWRFAPEDWESRIETALADRMEAEK